MYLATPYTHTKKQNTFHTQLEHERKAVSLYKELLSEVVDKSIYLEEYAKEMIKNEEIHSLTVEKMLKDYE